MSSDEHLAKLYEVAVLFVVNFNDTPRELTSTASAAVGCSDLISGTNNSEGNLGHDLIVLGNGLFIIQLVSGSLKDLDPVVLDIGQNLSQFVSFLLSWPLTQLSLVQATYASFEAGNFLIGECIGLGDDRDQVDLGVQAPHDLNVQRLQRVASGLNEEDASVDTVVNNVHAIDLVLSVEVCIIATLYVVNNGTPGLIVVDKVPESRGVNHGQAETNTSFLDVGADGLNLDSLGNDVVARTLAFSRGVQRSVEKRVDQSRLAKAGLAYRRVNQPT